MSVDWASVRKNGARFFGALIMEKDINGEWNISMGRVSWWVAFIPAMYIWLHSKGTLNEGVAVADISPNHFATLGVLAVYNFSKKAVDTANNIWGKSDGPG